MCSVPALLTGDWCYFLLTVRPYRGMLKYWSQFSQPIIEGRFTKRPEKIWNRREETSESQTWFTANTTTTTQITQLPSRGVLTAVTPVLTYNEIQTLQHSQTAAPSSPAEQLAKRSEKFSTTTYELRKMHAGGLCPIVAVARGWLGEKEVAKQEGNHEEP